MKSERVWWASHDPSTYHHSDPNLNWVGSSWPIPVLLAFRSDLGAWSATCAPVNWLFFWIPIFRELSIITGDNTGWLFSCLSGFFIGYFILRCYSCWLYNNSKCMLNSLAWSVPERKISHLPLARFRVWISRTHGCQVSWPDSSASLAWLDHAQ